MIIEMLEPVFDAHYEEHIYVPSCSPFHKLCEKCGRLNKVRVILGPYSTYDKERYVLLQHKCINYHPIWGREHTYFISNPWSIQDLLNVIGKDITVGVYKRLAEGKETFILGGVKVIKE